MLGLERIEQFVNEHRDPRTVDWFLATSSPWPTISLIVLYILSIKIFLPAYMKNREPFKLTNTIFYYNLFQVVFSTYLVYLNYFSGYVSGRYSVWGCRDLDRSPDDPDALMAAKGVHLYFIAKFTEFLDTIFFVLRKKDNQITFLHVYHHASMPFNFWMASVFIPGGSSALIAGTNSAIHVVMYTYYLLAGLGPQWQKYLWWKKYLTRFQIVQFAYAISQCILTFFTWNKCPTLHYYKPIVIYFTLYCISLLYLFVKFYRDQYKISQMRAVNKTK